MLTHTIIIIGMIKGSKILPFKDWWRKDRSKGNRWKKVRDKGNKRCKKKWGSSKRKKKLERSWIIRKNYDWGELEKKRKKTEKGKFKFRNTYDRFNFSARTLQITKEVMIEVTTVPHQFDSNQINAVKVRQATFWTNLWNSNQS